MKEFGSDFHYLPIQENPVRTIVRYYPDAVYYADGRQALLDLYRQNRWKRLWVPEYFCYEVLSSIERDGIRLKFYSDYPLADDYDALLSLPYQDGDVLLRVNYFGLRAKRSNRDIAVPVIEDHTHDLIGDWAKNSDADWCIASLRKTLPLAEGGILWSPKGLKLQSMPALTSENELLASVRWSAMRTKALYLNNQIEDKQAFRRDLVSTEDKFDKIEISAIDNESSEYIKQFDVAQWYKLKEENRVILKEKVQECHPMAVLEAESADCNPFSFTMLFDSAEDRNDFRSFLIHHDVYPAILWNVPNNKNLEVVDFSERMLSIHCDARYSKSEMIQLANIINSR